jgi:2'-5' RNA ligase
LHACLSTGPVVRPEAVYLPARPAASIRDLRKAVRDGIAEALGPDRLPDALESLDKYRPHVSVAYANRDQAAGPIVTALQTVQVDAIGVTFDHLSLLEFHRDHRMY